MNWSKISLGAYSGQLVFHCVHMTKFQYQAAIGVIIREHKFLMIKRGPTELAPGQICFPGGGVEDGEFVDQAVVRELDEELNVQVTAQRELWRSVSPRGTELCWWLVSLKPDQVIVPNTDEVAEFMWLKSCHAMKLPNLLGSNALFFQALEDGVFSVD